jgi:hypothetical protein
MSVHSISGAGPDVPPANGQSAVEPSPTSVLDLVNRTLADPARTASATKIVTSVSKGAAHVIATIGLVFLACTIMVGLLIHVTGSGSALGGAVAVGGFSAVAGGRYLWNRRPTQRRRAAPRRRS